MDNPASHDTAPAPYNPPDLPVRRRSPDLDAIILSNAYDVGNFSGQGMPLPEFNDLVALISSHFGIKLDERKRILVTGRILPMIEKYGFASHRDCLEAIKLDESGQLLSELANRISTNHTAFYRENDHFKLMLSRVLPDLVARKNAIGDRDIRVWCAACATGEEAYTILFTLLRFFHSDYPNWRAGVLATDISAAALETAKRGVYAKQCLEPIPKDIQFLYFNQINAENYEVKPEFRKELTFRRLNLMNDTYPFRQPFDFIFCRNVMIYFSNGVRQRLLERLYNWLVPGGCLFLGHSESLVGNHEGYEYIAPAAYSRAN